MREERGGGGGQEVLSNDIHEDVIGAESPLFATHKYCELTNVGEYSVSLG